MVFSSTVFLFIFFPLVLVINFLLGQKYRNFFLLIVSLLFYAWGEGLLVLVMIASTCVNYLAGLGVSAFRDKPVYAKTVLAIGVVINLLALIYYKYLNFIIDSLPFSIPGVEHSETIVLPIGISFYTFHGLSYLVDIYRKGLPGQKNLFDLGLYIAFFPQLIAGPIVRYSDIEGQLKQRTVNLDLFFEGTLRFIRGLAKKIIVANTCGLLADRIFALPGKEIPTTIAWMGAAAYALQIYFDFSGYSDMAIGLARMFGFHFKENFNYPYIAKSIQDFWRRWHISLSTWFRDYLYIPLGGNQKGPYRTYVNLIIVFFITGLWHGASWNFIVWGLFHGLFLILERSGVVKTDKMHPVIKHGYVLLVVLVGWVFFRAANLREAMHYLQSMAGLSSGHNYAALMLLNYYSVLVLILGVIFSAPVRVNVLKSLFENTPFTSKYRLFGVAAFHLFLFVFSVLELAQASYNPFIYFRF